MNFATYAPTAAASAPSASFCGTRARPPLIMMMNLIARRGSHSMYSGLLGGWLGALIYLLPLLYCCPSDGCSLPLLLLLMVDALVWECCQVFVSLLGGFPCKSFYNSDILTSSSDATAGGPPL